MEILAGNPGKIVEFLRDTDAARLLLEVGVLGKFIKNPHPGKPWFSLAYTACDTHYIVGVTWMDSPDPAGNGYLVHCFPRSHYTAAQIKQWALAKYRDTSPDPESIVGKFHPIADPGGN